MLSLLRALLSVLGRACLCAFFLHGTLFNKIPRFADFAITMRAKHIPFPKGVLTGMITFTLVGSGLVLLGFKARLGAFLLLVFLAVATYYDADFWNMSLDAQDKLFQFIKNVGLIGALLLIIANGSGAGSLERTR